MELYKKLKDYRVIIDPITLDLHLININPNDAINPGDICYTEDDITVKYVQRIPMEMEGLEELVGNIYNEKYKWVSIYEPLYDNWRINKQTCYENHGVSRIVLSNKKSLGLPKFNRRNLKKLIKD